MRTSPFIVIFLALMACVIDPHYEDKVLPYGEDVALLKSSAYVSHTSSEMVFETNVVVLNSFYEGFDNDYLGPADFEIVGQDGTYSIESFEGLDLEAHPTASTVLFLIDQSGSYESVDPYNTRFQAISKFLQDITSSHVLIVGASSRGGGLTTEPLEVASGMFGSDLRTSRDYLFDLSRRTGGENAIADAAIEAIDMLSTKPEPTRRQLVLLVHGTLDKSASTYEDIVAKAQSKSVDVHVIAIGEQPQLSDLTMLSRETGGLFTLCSTIKQLVKVFSELERLMNGGMYVYKLRIRFKPSQGLIGPASSWLHRIEIKDPFGDVLYNSIPVNITIPS